MQLASTKYSRSQRRMCYVLMKYIVAVQISCDVMSNIYSINVQIKTNSNKVQLLCNQTVQSKYNSYKTTITRNKVQNYEYQNRKNLCMLCKHKILFTNLNRQNFVTEQIKIYFSIWGQIKQIVWQHDILKNYNTYVVQNLPLPSIVLPSYKIYTWVAQCLHCRLHRYSYNSLSGQLRAYRNNIITNFFIFEHCQAPDFQRI